jgi:tetratricopeptide (TPR) repeat protein
MHDQFERKYYKAFGSCLQILKRYEEAMRNYVTAAALDARDPEPIFHTAECLVALRMPTEAAETLQIVLDLTKGSADYAAMRERAQAMLDVITQAKTKEAR